MTSRLITEYHVEHQLLRLRKWVLSPLPLNTSAGPNTPVIAPLPSDTSIQISTLCNSRYDAQATLSANIGLKRVKPSGFHRHSIQEDLIAKFPKGDGPQSEKNMSDTQNQPSTTIARSPSSSAGSWTGDEVFYPSQASKSTKSRSKSQVCGLRVGNRVRNALDCHTQSDIVFSKAREDLRVEFVQHWLADMALVQTYEDGEEQVAIPLSPSVETERGTIRRRLREWSRVEGNRSVDDRDFWPPRAKQ
jgi:hypothetical protein